MKKLTKNTQKLFESANKMVDNKITVQLFLKGRVNAEILKRKGITLANPL